MATYELIIVGGGPAALSAAFYARSKQLRVVMIYEHLGGKFGWRQRSARVAEEHYRSDRGHKTLGDTLRDEIADLEADYLPGNEVVQLLISRAAMQSLEVLHDRARGVTLAADGFRVETETHGNLAGTAVIVATGATPIPLDAPGARQLVGKGLGYSMTTYAHMVAGKRVAVVGGTRRALRGAAELARTAAKVFVIVADEQLIAPLIAPLRERPNVECLVVCTVKEIIGASSLEGLRVEQGGASQFIAVEHAFADLGLVPESALVRGLADLDAGGYIVVDARGATTAPGLFAAGDVAATPGEQVLIAVGDGVRAAMSAYEYLLDRWLTTGDSAEPPVSPSAG